MLYLEGTSALAPAPASCFDSSLSLSSLSVGETPGTGIEIAWQSRDTARATAEDNDGPLFFNCEQAEGFARCRFVLPSAEIFCIFSLNKKKTVEFMAFPLTL